jgi:sirohydrochlorin ferrochelatase
MKKLKTSLLIIDHGSKRKKANYMLFELVKMLRDARPDLIVYGAHMELAVPTIIEGVNWCVKKGATHIIAHPYMLSPGRHATEDIPSLLKKALVIHPTVTHSVTPPLVIDSNMVSLILKRAQLNDTVIT